MESSAPLNSQELLGTAKTLLSEAEDQLSDGELNSILVYLPETDEVVYLTIEHSADNLEIEEVNEAISSVVSKSGATAYVAITECWFKSPVTHLDATTGEPERFLGNMEVLLATGRVKSQPPFMLLSYICPNRSIIGRVEVRGWEGDDDFPTKLLLAEIDE
tara:strand:- start:1827 stop:2309 length:483 start_codon:yes stop_codon:yes gene_type:complete